MSVSLAWGRPRVRVGMVIGMGLIWVVVGVCVCKGGGGLVRGLGGCNWGDLRGRGGSPVRGFTSPAMLEDM